MLYCETCKETLPTERFYYNSKNRKYYQPCLPCAWKRKRERDKIERLKQREKNKKDKKEHMFWAGLLARREARQKARVTRFFRQIAIAAKLQKKEAYSNEQRRYHTEPTFKLRKLVSRRIRYALKNNKNNISILKHLPYSLEELKVHIESQFEPWMNWNNHGRYNADAWNDNDSTTWTWQIDHIIPHKLFNYNSMNDSELKKCWALSNLRPLSAKENLQKGSKFPSYTNQLPGAFPSNEYK